MDWNEVGKQIAHDMALREGRVQELVREEARLRLAIDHAAGDVEEAKAERNRVKSACEAEINAAKSQAQQAKSELATVLAQGKAHRAAMETEKDAHREKLAQLRAEHAQAARELKDDIARLVERREHMKADEKALLKKWSD